MADSIGGCSHQVLGLITAEELTKIIMLSVARGNSFRLMNRHSESIRAFEDAINIKQNAKAASKLPDRSIIFSAFFGITQAIAEGHIKQDIYTPTKFEHLRLFFETHSSRTHLETILAIDLSTTLKLTL